MLAQVAFGDWNVTHVAHNDDIENVAVSGNRMLWIGINCVWIGPEFGDIGLYYALFYYDGESTTQLTDFTTNYIYNYVRLYGRFAAWSQSDGDDFEVFIYDLIDETVTQLTDNVGVDDYVRALDSARITWHARNHNNPHGTNACEHSRTGNDLYYAELDPPTTVVGAISLGYGLPGDLDRDGDVDFLDFSIFAIDWLECIDPQDPNCLHPWEP